MYVYHWFDFKFVFKLALATDSYSMSPVRDSNAPPETQVEGESMPRPRRPLVVAFKIILRVASYLAIFGVIIWALVRYGEKSPTAVDISCNSRFGDPVGFEGDADFYGLGIRLGVYLQWLTNLITVGYLEKERLHALTTYHIFSISITVALFVKIFASACTFSAEIFIVLVLFWGGYSIVQIPMMKAMENTEIHRLAGKQYWAFKIFFPTIPTRLIMSSRRLKWSMWLLNLMMSPIMVWFWARVAAAEGVDFASTPGGTVYFFFARIHGNAVKPFSLFMATASTFNFLWIVYVLIPMSSSYELEYDDVSSLLAIMAWAPLYVVFWLPSAALFYLSLFLMFAFHPCVRTFAWFMRKVHLLIVMSRGAAISRVPTLESQKGGRSGFKRGSEEDLVLGEMKYICPVNTKSQTLTNGSNTRYEGVIPFFIAVWCIIAIELTLRWNSISHVYDIQGTGQIIPLVTGISGLLDTISKRELFQGNPQQQTSTEEEETHQSSLETTVQSNSSPSASTSPHQSLEFTVIPSNEERRMWNFRIRSAHFQRSMRKK